MKKSALLLTLLLTCGSVAASVNPVVNAIPMAEYQFGARPCALGGAYTSVASFESPSWNAGSLGALDSAAISAAFTKWNLDASISYLNACIPAGPGTVGLNIFYAGMGSVDGRDSMGVLTDEKTEAYSAGGTIGYGMEVAERVNAGLAVKVANQSVGGDGQTAAFIEAGLLYSPARNLSLGLALRNLGMDKAPFESTTTALGASYNFTPDGRSGLLACLDVLYAPAYGFSGCAGLEYSFGGVFAIRAGYDLKKEDSTLGGFPGISFGFGATVAGITLDYAAVSYGENSLNNTFSLSYGFKPKAPDTAVYDRLVNMLIEQYLGEAQEYMEDGEYQKAVNKLESLRSVVPDYPGIEEKIASARERLNKSMDTALIDGYFNAGMDYYVMEKYDDAVLKWEQAKRISPEYPGLDAWIAAARRMSGEKGTMDAAEKCFRDGLKYYNKCDYKKALNIWSGCSAEKLSDGRLEYFITKATDMSRKIDAKAGEAEKFFNKGNLVEGVKKVRVILTLCPVNDFAAGKLKAYKGEIQKKAKDYYLEGVDKYSSKQLVEAIMAWERAIEIDPEGNTATKARENIEKAREMLKAVRELK